MHINFLSAAFFAVGIIIIGAIIWDGLRRRKYTQTNHANPTTISSLDMRQQPTIDNRDGFVDDVKVLSQKENVIPETQPIEITEEMKANLPVIEDVLPLFILAKPGHTFKGYELLQSLLSVGLRFGEMSIFHRYVNTTAGKGPVLFSVANAAEPGTFDIKKMGSFSCHSLCCFVQTDKCETPLHAFDTMLESAAKIAKAVHGDIFTAQKEPLSEDLVLAYRYQLQEFEKNKKIDNKTEELA